MPLHYRENHTEDRQSNSESILWPQRKPQCYEIQRQDA